MPEENTDNSVQKRVYKKHEFKEFLKIIGEGAISHWVQIAEILKVDQNTIAAWREMPEAQEIIAKGIDDALAKMAETGGKDWRMWQEKAKLLGMVAIQKEEKKIEGELNVALVEFVGDDKDQSQST